MDDRELWRAWAEGDEVAGNRLVERYFPPIHRFFRSKVGDLADDLAQRTFLAAVQNRDRFRGEGSVRGYLYGIARKQLLRHFEGRVFGMNPDEVAGSSIIELAKSPSKIVLQLEEQERILRALHHLPLDMQIVLELHYWDELRISEIAQVLDVAPGTVKSRLYRARERMRKILDELPGAAVSELQVEQCTRELGVALTEGQPDSPD